jgi:hypothetical protein
LGDRQSTLILEALSRATRTPHGSPLIGSRKSPGLFPASAPGRQAAEQAQHLGLLERSGELFKITPRGSQHLLDESSPREVLDDVARAMESRGSQIAELIATTAALQAEWNGMQRLVASLQARITAPRDSSLQDLQAILEDWHSASDCPLPELFRRTRSQHPQFTIGQFHDHLRQLHADDAIYLHPWTGPLYALPEPEYALMVGHEVTYYASARVQSRQGEVHVRNSHPTAAVRTHAGCAAASG